MSARTLNLGILLWIIGSVGCAATRPATPPNVQSPMPIVSRSDFIGVIDAASVNSPNSWMPTEEEVLLAEPEVQACVLSERPELRSTLPLFVRHYQGWTFDGKRTLRVQFFDSRHFGVDELGQSAEVMDGDDRNYFVAFFDLGSRECRWRW